jgi:hypothetical protein
MKKHAKIFGPAAMTLIIGISFMACASTPIEEKYPERWEKTYVGMSLQEFKEVWPNASYAGDGENGGETYKVTSPFMWATIPNIELFVFDAEEKLVKWRNTR